MFFWASSSNHCLAAVDLGADVEQPISCLIIQNRQAVLSMKRSMDLTLENNIVASLFFSPTLKDQRGVHTPVIHTGAKTSNTGVEAVELYPGSSWEGRSGGWVPVSGMKMRSLVGLSAHSTFHWWSAYWAAHMLLLSEKLLSCCASATNGCPDLRRRASVLDGRISAEWSRCLGSMARRARDSVSPLRRSSAGLMLVRIASLSAGVGRRHPATIRKVSLMAGSMRRVWALWHQTGV